MYSPCATYSIAPIAYTGCFSPLECFDSRWRAQVTERQGGFHKPATVSASFLDSLLLACESRRSWSGSGVKKAASSLREAILEIILAPLKFLPAYPDADICECMYFVRVAGRVCPVVHKVDFVWPALAGRMLHRELNFKKPAQPSCRFDLAGHCMYVCVCTVIFPPCFLHICHVVEARVH